MRRMFIVAVLVAAIFAGGSTLARADDSYTGAVDPCTTVRAAATACTVAADTTEWGAYQAERTKTYVGSKIEQVGWMLPPVPPICIGCVPDDVQRRIGAAGDEVGWMLPPVPPICIGCVPVPELSLSRTVSAVQDRVDSLRPYTSKG